MRPWTAFSVAVLMLATVLMVASFVRPNNRTQPTTQPIFTKVVAEDGFITARLVTVEHDGHKFIIAAIPGHAVAIIHHPDCPKEKP